MIIYYEMLLLLKPESTQEAYDDLKNRINTIIVEENQGIIKNYDKWGKYLLAYPVQKCMYGFYVLVRFGLDKEKATAVIEKLKSLYIIRFNMLIMRHVVILLGKTIQEEYCRPDSFEDAPRRDNAEGEEWQYGKKSSKRYGKDDSSDESDSYGESSKINEESFDEYSS